MYIGVLLAGVALFFTGRYLIVRYELKRLHRQIDELRVNAGYGKRLYLNENDPGMANAIGAINRMVDEYENRLRRADEMERNVRHTISSISHDLRTPITSLAGYLQLLSKESSPEKQKEYLNVMFNAVDTLRELTESFFELSCLYLEEDTFSIQCVRLEPIVHACFLNFYEHFTEKHIELDMEDAKSSPVVLADVVALKRVLYNIIQNLLRYARDKVSVAFSESHAFFSVTIGNNTTTAKPIDIDRLFERFYTADPSRHNRSMGLGLYISQKLIHGMGGKITAFLDEDTLYITVSLPKAH